MFPLLQLTEETYPVIVDAESVRAFVNSSNFAAFAGKFGLSTYLAKESKEIIRDATDGFNAASPGWERIGLDPAGIIGDDTYAISLAMKFRHPLNGHIPAFAMLSRPFIVRA